ncbi:MAG: hypothetical protein J0L64_25580, partial [Acidobacteria bacterium]|nr:hypothetical protein [Acidobacteriota bacterium]
MGALAFMHFLHFLKARLVHAPISVDGHSGLAPLAAHLAEDLLPDLNRRLRLPLGFSLQCRIAATEHREAEVTAHPWHSLPEPVAQRLATNRH